MYYSKAAGEKRIDRMSLCCFEPFCDKIYLVRSARNLRREVGFERCKLGNAEGLKLLDGTNRKMFFILAHECDLFY